MKLKAADWGGLKYDENGAETQPLTTKVQAKAHMTQVREHAKKKLQKTFKEVEARAKKEEAAALKAVKEAAKAKTAAAEKAKHVEKLKKDHGATPTDDQKKALEKAVEAQKEAQRKSAAAKKSADEATTRAKAAAAEVGKLNGGRGAGPVPYEGGGGVPVESEGSATEQQASSEKGPRKRVTWGKRGSGSLEEPEPGEAAVPAI